MNKENITKLSMFLMADAKAQEEILKGLEDVPVKLSDIFTASSLVAKLLVDNDSHVTQVFLEQQSLMIEMLVKEGVISQEVIDNYVDKTVVDNEEKR